jgi:putative protease
VELLAPAGDWECAKAAVANGADAIYFGLPRFNARMRAENFHSDDLAKLVKYCHERGVKAFCAFNVLVFTDELGAAREQLALLADVGVDAVIVQDLGLARLAREAFPSLEVHASTQMTLTSPESVAFATRRLGIRRAVLARELSLRELRKFQDVCPTPIEVFVHGALCVAYSGQCLTSEVLGRRSANRGECAQACRMPYELVVDGETRDLGDRRFLLSPQDLAAVREIPELIRLGVRSFKIEGRLKTPEYVAAVTQVYRKAIDCAIQGSLQGEPLPVQPEERYALEMVFSRGLFTGWMHGVNHQQLVHGRFGKKRGVFLGVVASAGPDWVELAEPKAGDGPPAAKRGDGVVFETGWDTDHEEGGRIFDVRGRRIIFGRRFASLDGVRQGHRVWKTDDPSLRQTLRKSFAQDPPAHRLALDFVVSGRAGAPLVVSAREPVNGAVVEARTSMALETAHHRPLDTGLLKDQFGRLGGTRFRLGHLTNLIEGDVILPVSELNRLRREIAGLLDARLEHAHAVDLGNASSTPKVLEVKLARLQAQTAKSLPASADPSLAVLCRSLEQIDVVMNAGIRDLYADFEDVRRYREAVALARSGGASIWLATPRIQKAGEQGFFQLIARAEPDGVIVRNLGGLTWFADAKLRRIGDFSLNVANPLTAELLMEEGLERVTASYDLNAGQIVALLAAAPPEWFEITLHQHIPMFHMEHCVFAAFLSSGTDHTNCGRPCDRHQIDLRDRVGQTHPVAADVGCRNTVYHGRPQSGAAFFERFRASGARHFRLELLRESAQETLRTLEAYHSLVRSEITPQQLSARLGTALQVGCLADEAAPAIPTSFSEKTGPRPFRE